ncbi:MAG: ATP-binding cassette domain-containing protein, partial [Bacteroidota bacterium]
MSKQSDILQIKGLTVVSKLKEEAVPILKEVSFHVSRGETVGLMGPSGSGKSTLAYVLAQILSPPRFQVAGNIHYSILKHHGKTYRPEELSGKVSMIFQAPYKSLNPLMTCGAHLTECIQIHQHIQKDGVESLAHSYLERVKLPKEAFSKYPHQLSGGQIQRVMIALALSQQAELLIADEPTASLDIDTEKEILDLIMAIKEEEQFSLLLITHELAHVKAYADRILLLDKGELVEDQATGVFFSSPQSDTGRLLLESVNLLSQIAETAPPEPKSPTLSGRGISVQYESRKTPFSSPIFTLALNSLDIELHKNSCLGIMGLSGSGKSSLVKAIKGMTPMVKGEILLHNPGIEISYHEKTRPFPFHQEVQLISQLNEQLFDPRQKILKGLKQVYQLHAKRNTKRFGDSLEEYASQLGLEVGLLDRFPHQLSGGQLQRTNILRALLVNPN